MDKNSKEFLEKRESVRIPDDFRVRYKVITLKDYEKKATFYKNRSTSNRPEKWDGDKTYSLDWSSLENEKDCSSSLIKILSYIDKKLDLIISRQDELFKNISALKDKKEEFEEGECIDISGDGMKINIPQELKEDTLLDLYINPPIYPSITIVTIGKIIKVWPKSKKKPIGFKVSLRFMAINEHDRESLIKYIYKRQREFIFQKKEEID